MNSINKGLPLKVVFIASFLLVWGNALCMYVTDPPSDSTIVQKDCNEFALHGVDGPYLFKEKNKLREIRVIEVEDAYHIEERIHDYKSKEKHLKEYTCEVQNEDRDAFTFHLRNKIRSPKTAYKQPEKLLAIADIEGNFNAFYSLLVANGVMDEAYNWTYGEGHLVLVGDFVDRGTNVTQCLWLIYRLEQEAEKHGGMVHFILGNHEVLNIKGMPNYADEKYLVLAHRLSGQEDQSKAYKYLMSDQRELVKWMKSKNVIERIGNIIFVHGGLSSSLKQSQLSIKEINEFLRNRKSSTFYTNDNDENLTKFLLGPLGPLWYRGYVGRFKKYYTKASLKEVKNILKFYQADQIVIGHTVVKEISSDYEGMVYRIDIGFPPTKFSGHAEALLIEKDHFFRVNDKGEKTPLN